MFSRFLNILFLISILKGELYVYEIGHNSLVFTEFCQNPSLSYLEDRLNGFLDEYSHLFKMSQQEKKTYIEKHLKNIIFQNSFKQTRQIDKLICPEDESCCEYRAKLRRYDRFPFDIEIAVCKSELTYNKLSQFGKCDSQYDLFPILARGLCEPNNMEWNWDFAFEYRPNMCSLNTSRIL